MQTVSLTWQQAGELGAALAVVGAALAIPKHKHVRAVGAFLRETAIIAFLYGFWQLAGEVSGLSPEGGYRRAHWIERFEREVHLPSEASVQRLVLGHRYVVEVMNLYYDTMHFTMMLVFLLWLFVRHRDRYRPIRRVLAWTTLACLLVQLVPVAPPRLADPHIVDTAMLYHQSVYANGLAIDQLSAMPSVHVAWAVLVGYYVWRVSPSMWRFVGPLHSAITVFVVLATGNHWWSDAIVAVLLLVACAWGVAGGQALWRRVRGRFARSDEPPLGPQPPQAPQSPQPESVAG